MAGGTFTCEHCGVVFESEWSEADALVEYQANFTEEERAYPELPLLFCDDCYKLLMDQTTPAAADDTAS